MSVESTASIATDAIDSADLARRIAAGEEAAFVDFYRHWFPAALLLARAVSRRDESFCLDVVQDVMLLVAKKMPALRDEIAVRAWMTRTICRAIADRQRGERRRRRHEEHAAAMPTAASSEEPWQLLVQHERQHWLHDCLGALPHGDQALVLARFGDAVTVAAAGAALGLGEDAAHGRLRRAIDKMRQRAAEWWHER